MSEVEVRSFIRMSVLIAAMAAPPSLIAQWDVRMPQGVPRNTKGEPDLNGPVPITRTPPACENHFDQVRRYR